ncbi:MAG: hypothetical protein K2N12_01040 [Helicobacter sp.]|nr:hypothetical protein [Helicobacter sp.]
MLDSSLRTLAAKLDKGFNYEMDFGFWKHVRQMEAYQKRDSKQMVAPLCAACEQCRKWRGVEDGDVKMATNKKFKGCEENDYITSYGSAICFWSLARIYTQIHEAKRSMTPFELFASATNYGLAIELLLKTIISGESGEKPDRTHDLYKLFEKIDKDTQDAICNKYNIYIRDKKIPELFIRGVTSENSKEKFNNSTPPNKKREKDIKSLLVNNQDIFTQFRYMSERARTEEVEYFYFEYGYFDVLCEVLIEIIQERLAAENVDRQQNQV